MSYVFGIRLAGKKIRIESQGKHVYEQCYDYLEEFDTPDYCIRADYNEILREDMHKDVSLFKINKDGVAITPSIDELEQLAILRKIADALLCDGILLMHGAVVALNGFAYMFVAPSGVGKTTRIKLWMDEFPDSIVVNGDKPLIKITDSEVLVCGTPWCGKEGWNTNIQVPLHSIFILERASQSIENNVKKLTFSQAFPALLQQTNYDKTKISTQRTIELLGSMSRKVNLYKFCSTPTADAIRMAYDVTRKVK